MIRVLFLASLLACGGRAPVESPSATPVASPSAAPPSAAPAASDAWVVTAEAQTWTRKNKDIKPDPAIPVLWPRVSGPDPAVVAAVAALLTPEAVFGETRAEIEENGWADGISFEATYEQHGLLGLVLSMEGSAAYPDGFSRELAIDLEKGVRVGPESFTVEGRKQLINRLNTQLAANIAAARAALEPGDDLGDLLEGHAVQDKHLERFGLRPTGVVFHYAFGFPHVALAAEPDGDLLVPWAEIGPWLSPESPLRRAL